MINTSHNTAVIDWGKKTEQADLDIIGSDQQAWSWKQQLSQMCLYRFEEDWSLKTGRHWMKVQLWNCISEDRKIDLRLIKGIKV